MTSGTNARHFDFQFAFSWLRTLFLISRFGKIDFQTEFHENFVFSRWFFHWNYSIQYYLCFNLISFFCSFCACSWNRSMNATMAETVTSITLQMAIWFRMMTHNLPKHQQRQAQQRRTKNVKKTSRRTILIIQTQMVHWLQWRWRTIHWSLRRKNVRWVNEHTGQTETNVSNKLLKSKRIAFRFVFGTFEMNRTRR